MTFSSLSLTHWRMERKTNIARPAPSRTATALALAREAISHLDDTHGPEREAAIEQLDELQRALSGIVDPKT